MSNRLHDPPSDYTAAIYSFASRRLNGSLRWVVAATVLSLSGIKLGSAQEVSTTPQTPTSPEATNKETSNLVLNPKTTALVLIDLEQGNMALQTAPHPTIEVVQKSVLLARTFRTKGSPVIFSRVLSAEVVYPPTDHPHPKANPASPSNASDLVPELGVQPGDIVLTKRQWGAFYGTDLDEELRRRGIKTLVLGGIATNRGVETTARDAFDRGYALVFAEDAMSSLATEDHGFAVNHVFPLIGRVRTTGQIAAALR